MLQQLKKLNPRRVYNFHWLCSVENLHTTKLRLIQEKTEVSEIRHVSKISTILEKYGPEQERILKILNNYSLNELLGYEITKARANKLLAWRERFGLLNNLNDVFAIEGFGPKNAEKFFQSLLLEPKTNAMKLVKGPTRTATFVTPTLEAEQRKTIKSAVSVRIGVNSITWCRLDIPAQDINTPCPLTHWQHHEISDKKLHINELIQRCLYINHLIPDADCYLFENPQMAQASNNPGSAEQQNISIQKSQVTAMLGYALSTRLRQPYDDISNETAHIQNTNKLTNIFYIRRFLSARLFNRLVGTERVSSEEIILSMMRTFYNINDIPASGTACDYDEDISGRVQFPMELREMFAKAPRYYREYLCQALLLNLTFVRLVLLQDAKSIALVSRGGKAALK